MSSGTLDADLVKELGLYTVDRNEYMEKRYMTTTIKIPQNDVERFELELEHERDDFFDTQRFEYEGD